MIDQDEMRALVVYLRGPLKKFDNFAAGYSMAADAIDGLLAEVEGLRAARIAYASEFAPDAEGLPDTGNIHANIRKLKAELEAAAADKRILNQQIIGAQATRERYVQILSAIHGLLQPQDVKLEDGRVMRFSKPDLQIECYRTLSERIRAIPDELAALAQQQEQS